MSSWWRVDTIRGLNIWTRLSWWWTSSPGDQQPIFPLLDLDSEQPLWTTKSSCSVSKFSMFYVSLNCITLFTGGSDSSGSGLASILIYKPGTWQESGTWLEPDTWQEAGNMTVPRFNHAVAVFPDVSQLCPWWSGGLDINARAREGRVIILIALYLLILLCRTVNINKVSALQTVCYNPEIGWW